MNEMSMVNSMLTRLANALDWLGIIYVAFMFIAVIWKPNRIFAVGTFRLSIILYALSIMTPSFVGFGWNLYKAQEVGSTTQSASSSPFGPSRSSSSSREADTRMLFISQCASEAARIMLGAAIAMAILSLLESPHMRGRSIAASTPISAPRTVEAPPVS